MAQKEPFNYGLDKITEREVVFNFISRLSMGQDFTNQDYDNGSNFDDKQVIFPAGMKFKDEVLMNMIRTMDMTDIFHLDSIKTTYRSVEADSKSIVIGIPKGYTLYRIIQEKTGHDVTKYFTKHVSGGFYECKFDSPTTHTDIYKAYFYKE